MPPKLSLGLNLASKSTSSAPQKRKKPIFDDGSDDETQTTSNPNGAVEISSVGGLDEPSQPSISIKKNEPPAKKKTSLGLGGAPKQDVKPLSKKSIFADDEDDDEGANEVLDGNEGMKFGMNAPKKSTGNGNGIEKEYTNLSVLHSSKKHAEQAQELDPSIYSYDAVYDSLHAKPAKSDSAKAAEGPRYMNSLLRSAEVRKRDQLRAKDRMLAREREAEGDEFADKEKFVTSAYKAQQEELRKIEEEEAQKEKEEEERRRRNGGSGMVGFYKDMLSRGEQKHEEALKAAEETAERVRRGEVSEDAEETTDKEKTEAQMAAELNARGANVAINDEGQVVDKRQLLSAGLNVAPKPKPQPSAAARPDTRPSAVKPRFDPGHHAARAGQRARQTEMIAAQLEKQAKEQEEAEAARQREIAEKSRSQRTEKDVSSARERYLARKREREEAAKRVLNISTCGVSLWIVYYNDNDLCT
ncbi:Coiled-coil domain-containing protein [Aspergillus sclerotialis]|uniref:Coiled-coil domain-containing protein n=1 Tax=Aspergillus sclerotialis TaxID=2070753 RepID=A0A3A2ZFR5_9EURO|nr:Coiled-coil domain-containing protein [Aspergillus sclerotialis]